MIPRPGVPDGDNTGPNGRGLVFPEGNVTGPNCRGVVFPDGDIAGPNCRGLVFPDGDITGPDSQHGFRRVGTVGVLILLSNTPQIMWCCPGSPRPLFSQWSPSSFVVDGVSYSCAEQFMMAEKAKLFKDHRAVGLIMSPDLSTHKRIDRGVRNFDSAVWDR